MISHEEKFQKERKKEDPLHKVFRPKRSCHSPLFSTIVYSPLLAIYKDIINYKRDSPNGKSPKAHNHAISEKNPSIIVSPHSKP